MNQHTNCPQCGTGLIKDEFNQTSCPMCGWKSNNSAAPVELSKWQKFQNKSFRYRLGAFAGVVVLLLVITPVLGLANDQVQASRALSKAQKQMNNRLYASAARTLNAAPANTILGNTKTEMNQTLFNTIRWARDISEVKTAKKSIQDVDPTLALDSLEDIEEDFPQDEEVIELIDLAQDQTLDPELEITEELLDEIAYIPEDPELENLEELESTTEEQLASLTGTPPTGQSTTDPEPQEEAAPDVPIEDIPLIEEDEVLLEELPDGDEYPEPAPAAPGQPAPLPPLVPLYQLTWKNKASNPTDQDSFYTINVANEVRPKKDRRSNFGGYNTNSAIGSVFKRKPAGNPNVVPLYRYWSSNRTDHYYTMNKNFSSGNPKANYVRQQAAGYIGKWDGGRCLDGNKPLYNIYNSKLSDNFYSTDAGQIDRMQRNQGWVNSNIIGCIW